MSQCEHAGCPEPPVQRWPYLCADHARRAALTPVQRAYEDTYGREAQERQTELAKDYLPCCGEHKDDGHHEACSERPAVEEVAVHPDQEALL